MRNRISLLGGLSVLALAALGGCAPPEQNNNSGQNTPTTGPSKTASTGTPTFKVITNGISPFWDSMGKGLDAAKKEINCNADWQAPSQADNNAQVKVFNDAVGAKMDGIAVSAIDAKALQTTIDTATAQGIPVITFDSDSPGSKRLAYIGTNNFDAGKAAGEEAVKLFPNGGKLVAFVGNMSAQNARERYDGFKAALKGHNIDFLQDPFEDNKDKGRARKNVEDAISKHPDANGFVGLYSYNGPAIVDAVMAANLRNKVKIICFDGEPQTLENLGKGLVDVTVVQKPYEFGRLSVKLLYNIHKDKGDIDAAIKDLQPELDKMNMKVNGHIIDTGVTVVTPTNAADFLKELKEKGLEST